jgi:hypothetical protein
MYAFFAAHAAFEHTPYPPTPFHPRQGGKGSLTATLGFVAPGALLRSHGRQCVPSPWLRGCGRRDLGSVARGNGGRFAARWGGKDSAEVGAVGHAVGRVMACVRVRELGAFARAGERAAPRSQRAKPSAFTTTAGSPMRATKCAAQRLVINSVAGALQSNRYSAPLSALARVERGWGIGGELNTLRQRNTTGENT